MSGRVHSRDADLAARGLLASLAAGKQPDAGELATVEGYLRWRVSRAFPDVAAEDVVQTVILRLLSRSEPIDLESVSSSLGYLLGTAHNAAIDAIRQRSRRSEVEYEDIHDRRSDDDPIAAMLDRHASQAAVIGAMGALIATGDAVTVRIVTAWLDMADELGREPSTREVAPRAGVSHTRVAQALKRFRLAMTGTG